MSNFTVEVAKFEKSKGVYEVLGILKFLNFPQSRRSLAIVFILGKSVTMQNSCS
jgi:hypothetical protein